MKSGFGTEIYAFIETMDHVALMREFFVSLVDTPPGIASPGNCESPFTHLSTGRAIDKKYLAQHFTGIQQPSGNGRPGNAYQLRGPENPVDGITEWRAIWGRRCVCPNQDIVCERFDRRKV